MFLESYIISYSVLNFHVTDYSHCLASESLLSSSFFYSIHPITGLHSLLTHLQQVLTVVLVCKNFIIFKRLNRKADRGEIVLENVNGFRYTY